MKLALREHTALSGGALDSSAFSFEMNGIAAYTLMSGIAKDKVGYPIRELATNAWDATRARYGADIPDGRNFEVFLPTHFLSVLRVRDYGFGLSHQEMQTVYTRFFASTKRDTNEEAGGLGLGSKSPFAYLIRTDEHGNAKAASFTVRAFKDGRVRTYTMSLDPSGMPTMTLLDDSETDEESGMEVSFPVRREDIRDFEQKARFILWSFEPRPRVFPDPGWKTPEVSVSGPGWQVFDPNTIPFNGTHVRMGPVMYPLDLNLIKNNGFVNPRDPILFEAPIGSLTVQTSREALGYDDRTKTTLEGMIASYEAQFLKAIQDKVDAAETFVGAFDAFWSATGHFGWGRQNNLLSQFKWRGITLRRSIISDEVITAAQGDTPRFMILHEHWKKPEHGRFNSHSNVEIGYLRNAKIVIETKVYRPFDKMEKAGLVGEYTVWFRLKADLVDLLLTSLGMTRDDVVMLDDISLEPKPRKLRPDMKRRKVVVINPSARHWNEMIAKRQTDEYVDMNAGGLFMERGERNGWRSSDYVIRDNRRLDRHAMERLIRDACQAHIFTERLSVVIREPGEDLGDDWFWIGDYLDLRVDDRLDMRKVSRRIEGNRHSLSGIPLDWVGEAWIPIDHAPDEIRAFNDDLQAYWETINDDSDRRGDPEHDHLFEMKKTISPAVKHPTVSTNTSDLMGRWNEIEQKYPLLPVIWNAFRYTYSRKEELMKMHFDHYFDLLNRGEAA